MREMLERVASRLGVPEGAAMPVFENLTVETSVTLIAEPATLIPHQLEIVKVVEGSVSENGEAASFGQLEVTSYRYHYDD